MVKQKDDSKLGFFEIAIVVLISLSVFFSIVYYSFNIFFSTRSYNPNGVDLALEVADDCEKEVHYVIRNYGALINFEDSFVDFGSDLSKARQMVGSDVILYPRKYCK